MYEIFQPFNSVGKNDEVLITSWGIAPTNKMEGVTQNISRAAKVCLLVGFSKETHNLNGLLKTLLYYKKLGFTVKVLPSFHAKIWIIKKSGGSIAYVGSCNFCPDSIHNFMHKTKLTARIKQFTEKYWKLAHTINENTKLWLLPQK